MPELPEAEIQRENLESWLVGRRVEELWAPDPLIRRGQPEALLREATEGAVVRAVVRRGKFLLIHLEAPRPSLLTHLGMSGKWVLRRSAEADPPAVRAGLRVPGGARLLFRDPRRFGRFSVARPSDEERLARLGPEPLGKRFTGALLLGLLQATTRPVKALLMDQNRIAGIGNIQATESLWRAGIHPARPSDSLAAEEAVRLHRAIRSTLRRTIREARGLEIHYVSEGAPGRRGVETRFLVYGQQGKACPSCRRAAIERAVITGRSAFFCHRCQPL